LTSADWNKLTALRTADEYYTKDEVDEQFKLRGVGYKYQFESAEGTIQIRPGKFNTDSLHPNSTTFISLGPTDVDGKETRFAEPGDRIEIVSPITGIVYPFLVTQGNAGSYTVEYQSQYQASDAAIEAGINYAIYIYPTHVNPGDYYTKEQQNNLFLKKTEDTVQTLKSNVKYTGDQTNPQHIATVEFVNNGIASVVRRAYYGDYAPTADLQDGELWFDSMNLRLNVYSQGTWVNPDRNDGQTLEERLRVLEQRLIQLEGN